MIAFADRREGIAGMCECGVCGGIGLPGDIEEVETEFPASPGVAFESRDMFRLEKLRGDRWGSEDARESESRLDLSLPMVDSPRCNLASASCP